MEMQEKVHKLLTDRFPNAQIELSGDGCHFSLEMVAEEFDGKSRIERSRMIYEILGSLINSGDLHALQMNLKSNSQT